MFNANCSIAIDIDKLISQKEMMEISHKIYFSEKQQIRVPIYVISDGRKAFIKKLD